MSADHVRGHLEPHGPVHGIRVSWIAPERFCAAETDCGQRLSVFFAAKEDAPVTCEACPSSGGEPAVDAGAQSVRQIISRDTVEIVARPDGDGTVAIETIDTERYAANPRRATGNATFRDVESFVAYVNRHAGDGTAIFADDQGGMRAVFNHHATDPGWRDFTATLARPQTPAFRAWMATAGKAMSQYDFAEFLEVRLGEIAEPDGSVLLEAAQEFRAHKTLRFRSEKRLNNGQTQLEYIEQVEGGADPGSGKLSLPAELVVVLQPFRDSDAFNVRVRLRWSLPDRNVQFTLLFDDTLRDQLDAIYDAAIAAVREGTGLAVYRGTDA